MIIKVLASSSQANCTYISDGNIPLLLDAGLRLQEIRKALNFQVSSLSAAFVTHGHADHCRGIPDLIKSGVDCYMNKITAASLGIVSHRLKIISPLQQFAIGTFQILAFDLVHEVECLGLLLANKNGEKLVYITDSAYCPYRFKGLTHILIEANFSSKILQQNKNLASQTKQWIMKNHMSLETAMDFLKANDLSKVQEIYLLHLSDANSNAEMFKREIQELTGKPTFIAP